VVVLDLPAVASRVPRCSGVSAVGADLFASWPVRADVVLLARVLHDWDDEEAACILERAASALRPGGRILVVEMLLDESGRTAERFVVSISLPSPEGGSGRSRILSGWTGIAVPWCVLEPMAHAWLRVPRAGSPPVRRALTKSGSASPDRRDAVKKGGRDDQASYLSCGHFAFPCFRDMTKSGVIGGFDTMSGVVGAGKRVRARHHR
jgi:SAM-dependent methyltransferase